MKFEKKDLKPISRQITIYAVMLYYRKSTLPPSELRVFTKSSPEDRSLEEALEYARQVLEYGGPESREKHQIIIEEKTAWEIL